MSPTIAFIRGPFLNPWELQTYAPLASRNTFSAIGADWQFYGGDFHQDQMLFTKPSIWGGHLARLSPKLFTGYNRALSWTLGRSYGFDDLASVTQDADILHPAETYSTMTHQCLEIRQQRRCKVVATVWENLPHMGEAHPIRRARKRRALEELDGFLAVTETSKRMLIEDGAPADRIEVISMAVDLAHFKPAPRDVALATRWSLRPDEKVVLYVGRWVPEKGITELLNAIPEVAKNVPGRLRFCFVGAGPLAAKLQNAARLDPEHIQLIPFVSYDQLPALHNMADVFVLPSQGSPKWQEQFGYVLAESMACGKAIVTTRSGSIPDVVGDAALLSAGDTPSLAAALTKLLTSDPERARLGTAARQRALDRFDAQKNARAIESFYERVLARPS